MWERKELDCIAAENMVGRYISNDLSMTEMDQFLKHIDKCSSCYDELATQYIVNAALQQLNEEEDIDSDFKKLLDLDLKYAKRYIVVKKVRLMLTCLFAGIIAVALIYLIVIMMIGIL